MESRPSSADSLIRKRLSQGSLHQLERNAGDFASSRNSRVHNWVRTLGRGISVAGDPLFHGGCNTTAGYFPGFGQQPNYRNAGNQASSTPINNNTVRPDFTSHSPGTRPQSRTVKQNIFSSNTHLPNKAVPPKMPHKVTYSGDGQTSQPPSKKVFTETHLQAASTVAHIKSIIPIDVETITTKSSPQNASTSAPTVEAKTRSQKKDYQVLQFKAKIETVFPDICEKFVQGLYTKHQSVIDGEGGMTGAVEQALEDILEQTSYPKKVQRKRKQMADSVDDIDVKEVQSNHAYYFPVVLKILEKSFTFIPSKTIKVYVTRYKTLHKTYIALCQMRQPDSDANDYWTRLHQAKDNHPRRFAAVLEHELQTAKDAVAAQEDAKRKEKAEKEEKINEEKHRRNGGLVECQCCFGDVPSNRVVPCEGDQVHFFCNSCIRTRAETQVGMMHYEMKCFDLSGCQASFDSRNVRVVLGDKLMKKLEDLQQMDEIAKASIDGLDECPFCDFKAICPPIEQDKEFNCQNPECEKVSCRLCKEKTHIPLSCKAAKEAKKQLGRHAVEEAMTNALIRKCPKCAVAIIKEEGCNKLTCQLCHTLICDVCKKNISDKGYNHFNNFSGGVGGCPLHETDKGAKRRMNEVVQAEMVAMDSIIAKDAGIDPKLLRVSTQVSQSKPPASQTSAQYRVLPMIAGMPLPLPFPAPIPQKRPAPAPIPPPIHHMPTTRHSIPMQHTNTAIPKATYTFAQPIPPSIHRQGSQMPMQNLQPPQHLPTPPAFPKLPTLPNQQRQQRHRTATGYRTNYENVSHSHPNTPRRQM